MGCQWNRREPSPDEGIRIYGLAERMDQGMMPSTRDSTLNSSSEISSMNRQSREVLVSDGRRSYINEPCGDKETLEWNGPQLLSTIELVAILFFTVTGVCCFSVFHSRC